MVVNEGEGARLECNATGFPVPDVVWIKAGEEFTGQEVRAQLTIDAHKCTCTSVYLREFHFLNTSIYICNSSTVILVSLYNTPSIVQ